MESEKETVRHTDNLIRLLLIKRRGGSEAIGAKVEVKLMLHRTEWVRRKKALFL